MDFIGLTMLLIITAVLIKMEYRNYKVFYTPFILLAVPYCVIIAFQNFINVIYGFERCTLMYFVYIIMHFILIWFTDYIAFKLFLNKQIVTSLSNSKETNTWKKFKTDEITAQIIKFVAICSAVLMLIEFLILAQDVSELGNIVQTEFQEKYSGGIGFYLRLLSMIGCVYFLSIFDKKHKRNLFYGLVCLLPNALTFVKGIIFLNIIAGVLGNLIIHKRKVNLKIILGIGCVGILIFFGVYLVEYSVWDPNKLFQSETYEYIFAKLISYLISGVGGFNAWLIKGYETTSSAVNPVFAPMINLFAKFGASNSIETISNDWILIGHIPNYGEFSTNTMSYIGALVLHCGLFVSLIIAFLFAAMQSLLFVLCVKNRSIVNVIAYTLMASMFILGWFDYYFYQTFWVYLVLLVVVLAMLADIVKKCLVQRVTYDRS